MRGPSRAGSWRKCVVACGVVALLVLVAAPQAGAYAVWGPMRFSDGSKATSVSWANGTKVSGSLYICGDDSAYRQVSIGEYVRTGPDRSILWRSEVQGLPYLGTCPGTVQIEWDIPPGPSRVINLGFYGAGPTGSGYVGAYDSILELTVAHRPTLVASDEHVRNGDQVSFSGAIPAFFYGSRPTMALQVRVGKKWRTFKTVAVQSTGNFAGVYRFTSTTHRQTYKFRVKPLGGDFYPITLSPSTKARVTVKP